MLVTVQIGNKSFFKWAEVSMMVSSAHKRLILLHDLLATFCSALALAHRNQDAVQIYGCLGRPFRGGQFSQRLGQTSHSADTQCVDVDLTTECLQEREMDLQGDITLVFLISC